MNQYFRTITLSWLLFLIKFVGSVVIANDTERVRPQEQSINEVIIGLTSDDPPPNPEGPTKPGNNNDDEDAVQHYALIIFATVCSAAVIAAVTIIIVCYCRRRGKERRLKQDSVKKGKSKEQGSLPRRIGRHQ